MGLTFYVHPDNAAKLLPDQTPDLSRDEMIVLTGTRSYKASHGGKDRYQLTCEHWSGKTLMTRQAWDEAKASLITKGLLDKRGAITVAGRNVPTPRDILEHKE